MGPNFYSATNRRVIPQAKPAFGRLSVGKILPETSTCSDGTAYPRSLSLQPFLIRWKHRDVILSPRGSAGKRRGVPPPKLLDQVRARMRRLGLAKRTEEAYVGWIRRFILANGKRHPRDMGEREIESFLTDLAVRGRVTASTQTQALSALLFLYREVLGVELPWMENIRRAKRPERVPVVLSRDGARALLAELAGVN